MVETKVREYLPGDEESIVDLLIKVFGGWPHFNLNCSPLEHWRWKYLDNPKKLNAVCVAEDKGLIVGCEHGLFIDVKIGDDLVLAQLSGDAAIDPRHQGEGLYSKINKFRNTLPPMRRMDYSFWVTTNKKMIEFSRRRNYPRFPRRVSLMIRVKDLDLHFRLHKSDFALFKRLGYLTLANIGKIRFDSRERVQGDYAIKSIKKFGEGIDIFWASVQPYYSYIVARARDYLNWRYCDPRAGDNYIIQAEDDSGSLGYCVYKINRFNPNYHEGLIMDLITLPGRVDVAQGLLVSALDYLDDSGVNLVSCWGVEGQSNTGVLRGLGFVDSRAPLDLSHRWVSRQVDESKLLAAPPDKLHCQMGDLDF